MRELRRCARDRSGCSEPESSPALAYAGWRAWQAQVPARHRAISWETAPFPFPPVPRPSTPRDAAPQPTASTGAAVDAFVDPDADGACPVTHPVKAKLTSGIYHVPGGGNYDRTKADRCYVDRGSRGSRRPARRQALTRHSARSATAGGVRPATRAGDRRR